MGSHAGASSFDTETLGFRGRYGAVRKQYNGWIKVEKSMFDQIDKYTSEHFQVFNGGWITVQQLKHTKPLEVITTTSRRCYMFDLVLGGHLKSATISLQDGGIRAEPEAVGRVIMVAPEQTVISSAVAGQRRTMRCYLDADLIEGDLPRRPDWNGRPGKHDTFSIGGGEIEWFLRRMYRELTNPDFASKTMIETLARQLAVEVIRSFNLRESDERCHVGGLSPWRVRLIRERVYSEGTAPSLDELASLCAMTVRHLNRAFRVETGKTLGKFVEAAVMERANDLLSNGKSVKSVATSLGYATSGSFATAFRRATGIRPSELKALSARNQPRIADLQ